MLTRGVAFRTQTTDFTSDGFIVTVVLPLSSPLFRPALFDRLILPNKRRHCGNLKGQYTPMPATDGISCL
jgi:hypothetical protein